MRAENAKVAFITGIARGQGRAHAVRLAREGVAIVGIDLCAPVAAMDYPAATEADMAETVRLVEDSGGSILASVADVRDFGSVESAVDAGVAAFGRLDIVVANAGIIRVGDDGDDFLGIWNDIVAVNLTGVFHTVKATARHLIAGGRGGSCKGIEFLLIDNRSMYVTPVASMVFVHANVENPARSRSPLPPSARWRRCPGMSLSR